LIDKIEVNRIENILLQSQSNLENAKSQKAIKTQELKMLLGLPSSNEISLTESLFEIADIPSEAASIKNATNNLDFKIKQLEFTNSLTQLSKEKLKTLPELSAFFKYGKQSYSNTISDFSNTQNWYNNGIVGVKLSIPIFKGLSRTYEIYKAKELSEISNQENAWLLSKVTKDDFEMSENYQAFMKTLNNSKKIYESNTENLSLATFKYVSGIINTDAVMNIYRETLNSQSDYLKTLSNLLLTKVSIQLRNEMDNIQ
jgi:outer membrane protein TolC